MVEGPVVLSIIEITNNWEYGVRRMPPGDQALFIV